LCFARVLEVVDSQAACMFVCSHDIVSVSSHEVLQFVLIKLGGCPAWTRNLQ